MEFWTNQGLFFRQLLVGIALLLAACHSPIRRTPDQAAWQRFEFTQPQMGLPFRLVFYAPDAEAAASAARDAFQRVSQMNQILSDYETDSELNLLARTSGQNLDVKVSPELWKVLVMAQRRSQESDGAFDVSVGPLITLWRKARREHQLPHPDRIQAAMARVGYGNIVLNPKARSVRLLLPNMHLDLGGIAKGFALDEALRVLQQHGFNRALVTGGGDMALGEAPPGKSGWKIEVPPLGSQTNEPSQLVHLRNCGFATSGDAVQKLEINGVRYSHIVNPKTGLGLTDHSLVYVIAPDTITADCYSTTLSVLGPSASRILLARIGAPVSARMLRKQGSNIEVVQIGEFPILRDD